LKVVRASQATFFGESCSSSATVLRVYLRWSALERFLWKVLTVRG